MRQRTKLRNKVAALTLEVLKTTLATVYFRPEVLPEGDVFRIQVIQETDAGRPIQVFDLGPWPLSWEAAVILANEAVRERAALYEETMTRIHAEMMEGLR